MTLCCDCYDKTLVVFMISQMKDYHQRFRKLPNVREHVWNIIMLETETHTHLDAFMLLTSYREGVVLYVIAVSQKVLKEIDSDLTPTSTWTQGWSDWSLSVSGLCQCCCIWCEVGTNDCLKHTVLFITHSRVVYTFDLRALMKNTPTLTCKEPTSWYMTKRRISVSSGRWQDMRTWAHYFYWH